LNVNNNQTTTKQQQTTTNKKKPSLGPNGHQTIDGVQINLSEANQLQKHNKNLTNHLNRKINFKLIEKKN
jgi:hypothetical protein